MRTAAAGTAAAGTAAAGTAAPSYPDGGGGLVVVLRVEGDHLPGQNHVVRSHGGLQENVDIHLRREAKELQQHRFHGVQPQRQGGGDQIPEGRSQE